MESKYPCLSAEVQVINSWQGSDNPLEALKYIRDFEDEYRGTQVHREYRAFLTELTESFA
jgi:hypothetical protein